MLVALVTNIRYACWVLNSLEMLSLLTSLLVRCKDRGNTDGQDYNEGLKVVMSANLWYRSNHCIPNIRKHTLLVKWFSGGGAVNNGAVLKSLYQITYVSTHTLSNALLALVFSVSTIQPLLSRESAVEKVKFYGQYTLRRRLCWIWESKDGSDTKKINVNISIQAKGH